jgi:hypothetical protein
MITYEKQIKKVIMIKCFIILEMLNFSMNFLFYIIFSPSSRKEFFLIVYYYTYWKWSKEAKTLIICNHLHHNPLTQDTNDLLNNRGNASNSNTTFSRHPFYKFNVHQKKKFKIYCFLTHSARYPIISTLRKPKEDLEE